MSEVAAPDLASVRSTAGWPRQAPDFQPFATPISRLDDLQKLKSLGSIEPTQLGAWIDRLRDAGVSADRRNCPNLLEQLNQALRRPIDVVLCCLLDADPAACLNAALAAKFPLELVAGVVVIGRITAASRVSVITDVLTPADWFAELRQACDATEIDVEPIINDYPQADPTLLLYTMLGRRLRPGRSPAEQGVLLLDAAAAVAIGRRALLDEKMSQSPIVLRDHETQLSHYLTVPLGTKLADIFARLGISETSTIIRQGDVLKDVKVGSQAHVSGSELIFHTTGPQNLINPAPCIRCGWCVDACPTRVQPVTVLEASQIDDIELAERAGIEACIECGICTYVCPSQLALLDGIRSMMRAREKLTAT